VWLGGLRTYYIGVDEAGRGPVVGDMVVAGVAATPRVFENLTVLGVKDSKLLTPSKRMSLYREIINQDTVIVLSYISPRRLDSENLNILEENAIIHILTTIAHLLVSREVELHIFIDEIKGRSKSIENRVKSIFNCPVYLTIEPNADAKYPPVATASIIAKVARDLNLKILRGVFGDFGSGYITDPATRNWILEYYYSHSTPPLFIRRSWRTLRKLAPLWYSAKRRVKRNKSLLDYTKT